MRGRRAASPPRPRRDLCAPCVPHLPSTRTLRPARCIDHRGHLQQGPELDQRGHAFTHQPLRDVCGYDRGLHTATAWPVASQWVYVPPKSQCADALQVPDAEPHAATPSPPSQTPEKNATHIVGQSMHTHQIAATEFLTPRSVDINTTHIRGSQFHSQKHPALLVCWLCSSDVE